MRGASMPDSRATMVSASSEVARCWVSKSAGTYSASITGVIGSTLSRRAEPLQVCDSVAAVAIAGFARSVSARSIGTRMDLNIGGPPGLSEPSMICAPCGGLMRLRGQSPFGKAEARACILRHSGARVFARTRNPEQCAVLDSGSAPKRAHPGMTERSVSSAGGRLQQFRADEQLDPAAPERGVAPMIDIEV